MKTKMFLGLVAWMFALSAMACSPQPAANAPANDASASTGAAAALAATPTSTPAPATTPDAQARTKPDQRTAGKPGEQSARMGFEVGVVVSNAANALTIKTRGGDQTITLAPNALVLIAGKTNATASDLKRGDRVLIQTGENKDAPANFVMVLPANFAPDNQVMGQVESVSANSITLKTKNGSQTIALDAATSVVKFTPTGATLSPVSDLQNAVGVIVIKTSSGTDAKALAVVALGKGAPGAPNAKKDGKAPKPGK